MILWSMVRAWLPGRMASLEIPSDYGYVAFVVVGLWVMMSYLSFEVMKARKRYGVKYPALYSETSHEFNCIQRAHQNTLEIFPQFLAFLLLGGLYLPKLSAFFGVIGLISRLVYAWGYYTFKPVNRKKSLFGYIGFLGLVVNTILFGLHSLDII